MMRGIPSSKWKDKGWEDDEDDDEEEDVGETSESNWTERKERDAGIVRRIPSVSLPDPLSIFCFVFEWNEKERRMRMRMRINNKWWGRKVPSFYFLLVRV
jgi:hypothetical protein